MDDSADSSSSTNPMAQGCGPQQPHRPISIHISPTTGGDFHLTVEPDITVENLKKLVSKKLKVPRDRLCLLFRDKQLQDGNIVQHGIADGSKVTLLPNVETGLVTQRPEIGIMQALESLNDTQVNEFLCGKAPLNLSMRLGDHMMLIQLQLSTVSGAGTTPTTSTTSAGTSAVLGTGSSNSVTAAAAAAATAAAIAKLGTSNPAANGNPAHYPLPPPGAGLPVSPGTPTATSPTTTTSTASARPPSLVQASRNLQHTLRRLSADVFGGGGSTGGGRSDEGSRHRGGGSVYSGTFSGALNPALQDTKGRPRRDVATIVHILNDLLCSAPDLRRVGSAPCPGVANVVSPVSPTSGSTGTSRRSPAVSPASSATAAAAVTSDHRHHHHHHQHHHLCSNSTHTMETVTGCCVSTTPSSSPTSHLLSPMGGLKSTTASQQLRSPLIGTSTTDQDQNLRTRGKLEQLRLVMGERRERRRQRKRKPYQLPGTGATAVGTAVAAGGGVGCSADSVTA